MPKNTFDLQRMQDIQMGDQGLQDEYIKLWQTNNINGAQSLVNNTPQLQGKAITPQMLKSYVDAINTLEQNYFTNVNDLLDALEEGLQKATDDIIDKGNWNPLVATDYKIGNFVTNGPDTYMCIKDGTYSGDDINNPEYFLKLEGLQGDEGVTGLDVWYTGTYDSLRTYGPKDVVTYNNQLYVSKTTNTSAYPDISPDDWMLALQVEPKGIDVKTTEPPGISPGMFWWEAYDMYRPLTNNPPQVYVIDGLGFTASEFDNAGYTADQLDTTDIILNLSHNSI